MYIESKNSDAYQKFMLDSYFINRYLECIYVTLVKRFLVSNYA